MGVVTQFCQLLLQYAENHPSPQALCGDVLNESAYKRVPFVP
jgi:hypothetical protein